MTDKNKRLSGQNELDTVVEAGRILMESGAEIYRIEETMAHIADALQVERFDAYVVNRGIFASGTNHKGVQEAKIVSIPETSVHLGRIEAVNSLSREIEERRNAARLQRAARTTIQAGASDTPVHAGTSAASAASEASAFSAASAVSDASAESRASAASKVSAMSLKELNSRLRKIRKETADPTWAVLLSYFLGAGSFSLAMGSTLADSAASAISGLAMGLVLFFAGKHVHTAVLRTIIGSAVVTISANLLYLFNLGDHRGLIILGGLMLLVPGAAFTNSVREFSQNNYSTGLTLLMSALLTCLSIAIGVVLATEFLPFADQMTDVFSSAIDSFGVVLVRTVMAGIGTVAFSYLFHAPVKYYPDLGLLGAVSWFLYLIMNIAFHNEVAAIFVPALAATLLSRILAVLRKCPVTIFLSTSIFPLIPGLSFYRGVYFMMTGTELLGWTYMRSCFITAFSIAIAISVVQQIPAGTFIRLAKIIARGT